MLSKHRKNKWLVHTKKVTQPSLRLFCFHYAGGSASFCNAWPAFIPESVELVSIQLPGRENRYGEPFITEMSTLLDNIMDAIRHHLEIPFAFYGHSMGATIAFELIRKLQQSQWSQPRIFFSSGRQAPQFADEAPPLHRLPEDEFCNAYLERHFSEELAFIFADNDLRKFFIPQLRADLKLIENYRFNHTHTSMMDCVLIAMDGDDPNDSVGKRELAAWKDHTTNAFRAYRFPGNHFFIDSSREQVLDVISKEMRSFISEF